VSGAQDVALEIAGDGVTTIGESKQTLHLAKGDARGVRFVVKADKAGDRKVRINASSATHSDAMERTVHIVPNGQAFTRARNGRVNGSAKAAIDFPDHAIDGGNDLYVKIYGGPLSQISEGLEGVFRMPHGCFEQTSSTTYPSVLALQFLRRTKQSSPDVEKKARETIAQGYQRLVTFEVSGGGFSLFGNAPADTALTAYGLLEFADMAKVAPIDEMLVARTRDWLFKMRSSTGGFAKVAHGEKRDKNAPDDPLLTAYAAWALAASTAKPEDDQQLKTLLEIVAREAAPDDPYALALRATALIAGGRAQDARPLLERLSPLAIKADDGVRFTSKSVGVLYSYGASMDVEATGLAAHALSLGGVAADVRAGALDWLAARRGAYGTWSTTQATIAAMRAMLDEAKPVTTQPQTIRVAVDGQEVESFTLEPKARDVHRLIGLRKFATTGAHGVDISATGDGDVSYQLVATHYLPWQKSPASGLSLEVAYGPSAVDAGSTMTCHAKVAWRGKEAARMPLVEIGVPPAFEPEAADLDALVAKSIAQRYTIERGKVTLYFVALPEEKPIAFDLRLRALRPARVFVPSSTAFLYYEPEVRVETAPLQVRAL
jgi:hypothetical protein